MSISINFFVNSYIRIYNHKFYLVIEKKTVAMAVYHFLIIAQERFFDISIRRALVSLQSRVTGYSKP